MQIDWEVGEDGSDEDESDADDLDDGESARPEPNDVTPLLAHLPVLSRLEAIDLRGCNSPYAEGWTVGVQNIRRLAVLPRLKSLNVSDVYVNDAGLAELASLKSLRELAIGGDTASAAGLRALFVPANLRALHIQRYAAVTDATLAELPNQDALGEITMPIPSISQAAWRLSRALKSVRALHLDQDGSDDKSDRLTTVALDHGDAIFALESEVDDFLAALQALRQANPGIVIDSDPKWFVPYRGANPFLPWLTLVCGAR
ncbi:MAG TPA: hypothetical protein VGX78_21170 [Pirellulales bacterium]|nr:hypothetical protein [Pirellulales bacterium]